MLYAYQTEHQILAKQLKKSIIAFDKYIISNHLWLDNTIFNVRSMEASEMMDMITKEVIPNFDFFIEMGNQQSYKNEALIQLHLSLRQLLESKKEEDFLALFESLKRNHSLIQGTDYSYFYKFMVNYCIRKVIQGDSSYYGKSLDIYLFTIDIGAFVEGKYLEPKRLGNIIITAVRSGQPERAHELLDKYIELLNPIYQSVTETYCRGYLYFQQKKYDSAIDKLQQCLNFKSLFELDTEAIIYKIYYETKQTWAFDVPLQSCIRKLSRKSEKYPKYIIDDYINFLNILKQINRKREDPNYNKTVEYIIEKINNTKYLSDKQWLLEKIKELEK